MSIPIELNPLGVPKDNGPNIFQLTVKITDAPNQTLNLSQANNTINNAIIKDWGDGTIDNKANHTYVANGTYIVSLSNPNNITLSPFYPWKSSSLVVGCNWKWDSLGDVRSVHTQYLNNYSIWESGVCTSLPSTLTSMSSFFAHPADLPCYITSIPDSVTNLQSCGNMNANATFVITKLPPNVTSISRALRNYPPKRTNIIDIDEIVKNAPINGFTQLTHIGEFAQGCQVNQGATIAKFMNKCPNVTNIGGNNVSVFNDNSSIEIFGENDHFECTVNIPTDNYVWGFTPISTGGTWYLVQWGDSTDASPNYAYKASKSLYIFTSGTKVTHTYAKAGTYTIKLCAHTDSITFDSVVSHNNQLQFLGNVNGVSFN